MNKFYTAILVALMCLTGLNASAFTIFVDIDHPENITGVKSYYYGSTGGGLFDVEMTGEMPLEVYMPDEAYLRYIYLYVAPGSAITDMKIVDEFGVEIWGKSGTFTNSQTVSLPVTADYGTLYVSTASLEADASITVNIDGDPAKLALYFYASLVEGLQPGTNVLNYVAATQHPVYILPQGVPLLYQVKVNGEEVKAVMDWEGRYQYTIEQKNGDVIDIVTDFPDIDYNVTISVTGGCEDFIGLVTVAGNEEKHWSEFTAHAGTKFVVTTDLYNYKVNSFIVNGREASLFKGQWDSLVTSDLALTFDVERIERPYSVTTYTANWEMVNNNALGFYGYEMYNSQYLNLMLADDYGTINFNDADNPFGLKVYTDLTGVVHLFYNDAIIPSEWDAWELNFADGDLLKIYISSEQPQPFTVNFVTSGVDELPIIVRDKCRSVDGSVSVLPGTEFVITPGPEQEITGVMVDDTPIAAADNDSYTFTVRQAATVTIIGNSSGITTISADDLTGPVYNLQGIRVSATDLPAGIYIVGGQKVLVR